MRTPTTNWTTLMAQPHETETRIDINNVSYYGYDGESGIWSCETRPMLFDKLSVGNCCSATINLVLALSSAHWWKKSSVAYVKIGNETTSYILEESLTLYKNYYVHDGTPFGAFLRPYDGITVPIEEVNDAIQRGYIYFGSSSSLIMVLSWDGYDEDEGAWLYTSRAIYSPILEPIEGHTPAEGDEIGEVSGSENSYPQYGEQGGFWYSYIGERAATIPTMAKMELYVRLTNGTLTTDWVRKGVYYIDTREWDAHHKFLTITGYDAMLKTEQNYFTPPVTITGWPKTDAAVVSEICTRIGVELDTRTVLNKGYMVQVPAVSSDGSDSDTLREVLGWIGGMYGGNWCITDEGKLRLVPLVPTDTVSVGTDALDLSTTPAYDAIGIVHLVVSEDAEYIAPQSGGTGRSIEIFCPWGTQTMANNILTAIGGYVYQPLSVTTATKANPLWELGDGVTVNGYTSVIVTMPTAFGLKYTADIEAPESEEINHEYPYQDKGTREIDRKIAKTSASLEIANDKISAIVQNVGSEGTVTAASIIAAINDDTSEVKISADKIGITGFVTFSDLSTSGKTTINGANITTGTIAAERLDLSGTLRVGSNISNLTNNVGYQTESGVTTIIDDTIDTGYINALGITARYIKGNRAYIYGSDGSTAYGSIYAGTNTVGTTALELYGNYGTRVTSNGNVWLYSENGGQVIVGNPGGSGARGVSGTHISSLICSSFFCMNSAYYGTSNPSSVISSPVEGMLYFKIT